MFFYRKHWRALLLVSGLAISVPSPRLAHASCGQAFCTVEANPSSKQAQVPWQLRLDGQMEYIEQDQPWVGYHPVSVGAVQRLDHQEVETTNLTWKLRAELALDEHWSFGLALPIVHREHLHLMSVAPMPMSAAIKHQTTMAGEPITIGDATGIPERWNYTELGDLEATVRYSIAGTDALPDWWLSIFAGLKLPSARTRVHNDSGDEAELPMQPGTGSVDPLFGLFLRRSIDSHDLRGNASRIPLFTSVSLHPPGSDGRFGYRPGLEAIVSVGSVYPLTENLDLLGQINFRYKDRDHPGAAPGVEAEHSGGETVHLSPGVRVWLSETTALSGYFQVPVLRRVNGIQLVSDWNLLFAVSHEINL